MLPAVSLSLAFGHQCPQSICQSYTLLLFESQSIPYTTVLPKEGSMTLHLKENATLKVGLLSLGRNHPSLLNRVEAKGKKSQVDEECIATRELPTANIVFSKDDHFYCTSGLSTTHCGALLAQKR